MIKIQSLLICPEYKTQYWMQDDENKPKKISKTKWDQLYDRVGDNSKEVIMCPPLTIG